MSKQTVNQIDVLDREETPAWMMGLSEALLKAMDDVFHYALMLRDGTIIEFECAQYPSDEGWVHLDGPKIVNRGYDACLERGIEVRLTDIVWVTDAPHGSYRRDPAIGRPLDDGDAARRHNVKG
jgi:hypothetical protein